MALYGKETPMIPTYNAEEALVLAVNIDFQHKDKILQIVKKNLKLAQTKNYGTKNSAKTGFKVFQPFKIIKKMNVVAYKLQLFEEGKIHPTSNCWWLQGPHL